MSRTGNTPTEHLPDMPRQCGLSKEDWLIIDAALHRVARSLRKIEREEQQKEIKNIENYFNEYQKQYKQE